MARRLADGDSDGSGGGGGGGKGKRGTPRSSLVGADLAAMRERSMSVQVCVCVCVFWWGGGASVLGAVCDMCVAIACTAAHVHDSAPTY
jgi:hypothetical protein